MKSAPSRPFPAQTGGMWSADPADRIEPKYCALLKNGFIDRTGRVVKARGISMVATAADLRMTASSARAALRSMHTYEGVTGQNPSSRLLVVLGSSLLRSKADSLHEAFDAITFPATITAPALDRPAAGVFRRRRFYHQNGADIPFAVVCETDDGTAPSAVAETMGLPPPPYAFVDIAANGVGTRFPKNKPLSYCVTYVYGERGESGPSPVEFVSYAATDVAKFDLRRIPLGPTGVTARRIYRCDIGRSEISVPVVGGSTDPADWERPPAAMYFLHEIKDNTTEDWSDQFDDSALDHTFFPPDVAAFPPLAKYQVAHLDRLFWANLREHPWVMQVVVPKRFQGGNVLTGTLTISNTGTGTITLTTNLVAPNDTLVISSYKTKTLRQIRDAINSLVAAGTTTPNLGQYDGVGAQNPALGPWVAKIGPLVDETRTYTFMEVTALSIWGSANAAWLNAIDDATTQGTRWYPNRVGFSDLTAVDRFSAFNTFDLTTEGSKKITGMVQSLNASTLVVFSESKPYVVSGTFAPDASGLPDVRVDPAVALSGQIATRPDALAATDAGVFFVAYDALRLFRGAGTEPAGRPVQDWFARVLREPVTRDHLCMIFFAGRLWIALPTDEVAP